MSEESVDDLAAHAFPILTYLKITDVLVQYQNIERYDMKTSQVKLKVNVKGKVI